MNSKEGVLLWGTKQLFLSIKDLTVLKEGLLPISKSQEEQYYVIQTNQDFYREKATDLYHLTLFVDSKNYHVYMPQKYDESKNIQTSTVYVEYEPNEITKKLIDDVIKQ